LLTDLRLGVRNVEDCLFCKIAKGEIPSKKVYEDDKVYAFYDINPEAPVHFLVIPKEHIQSANSLNDNNAHVISHIFKVINKLVVELNIADKGYRIVNNCGEDGGQTVNHIHFHVLGGRNMQWPPG
jgi:histidine triad (HIT) family protein